MMKPVIGITPSPVDHEFVESRFNCDYTAAIEAAGGIPIVLPPLYTNVGELLSVVDGVLLAGGGGDIGPQRYGDETIHHTTSDVHDRRDDLEIALVRAAITRGLPLLSICRGSQILNIAFGGALYQDIPDQHGTGRRASPGTPRCRFQRTESCSDGTSRIVAGACVWSVYDSGEF